LPHDGTTVGQLIFTSGSLARGYWGNPEATASSFRDGWYHSGDLGTIDPEGYVYISDRRADLILSGGMNVYPSEIERVLLQLEGVRECAVIAAPHERWGQTPVAFVVVNSDSTTPDIILDHAREHLAGYKLPSRIEFLAELPKNASNKIMRARLREQDETSHPHP